MEIKSLEQVEYTFQLPRVFVWICLVTEVVGYIVLKGNWSTWVIALIMFFVAWVIYLPVYRFFHLKEKLVFKAKTL